MASGEQAPLEQNRLDLLAAACDDHADGVVSAEPTIGACWDADRLDLPRVGIRPDPMLLSTDAARARNGNIHAFNGVVFMHKYR